MRRALLIALIAACQPVREDRTIEWSPDGGAVGFQHGPQGVYVADRDGATLEKIHDPDKQVIATSAPLFAPGDRRLIFTTAKPIGEAQAALLPFDPAGAIYVEQPVIYTCWLRRPGGDGPAPAPEVLFRARCAHPGYVAANLAVRWEPSGLAVLFIDREGETAHGIYRFDLRSAKRTKAFPHSAEALLFDFAPDGSLVCVLDDEQRGGIWLQRDAERWRHIPATLATGRLPSRIEALRATRPAFTPDGKRFAFVMRLGEKEHALRLASVESRAVHTLATGDRGAYRDLHWSPDGKSLGVVHDERLQIYRNGRLEPAKSDRSVRRFAGWNAAGNQTAIVVPDRIPHTEGPLWSFLLAPDPRARDAVIVGGREVVSGMRVTFPRWSPTENKLSVWFTFAPTHRSMLSILLGTGLRPGDPAAIFSPDNGGIAWMAVNAWEKEQIGHYQLLKGKPRRAWRWYERAARDREPQEEPLTLFDFMDRDRRVPDIALFESICLKRLGRVQEAAARRTAFEQLFGALAVKDEPASARLLAWLVRDLYVTEVYCSIDSAGEAATELRAGLAAKDLPRRLSAAMVLSQILLVQGKHTEYADLVTDTLVPDWRRWLASDPYREALGIGGLLAELLVVPMLPLLADGYLKQLPRKTVAGLVPRWKTVRAQAKSGHVQRVAHTFLRAAYRRLGDKQARFRLERGDAPKDRYVWLQVKDPDDAVAMLRRLLSPERDAMEFAGMVLASLAAPRSRG